MSFSLFVYLLLMTPTGIALSWANALVAALASLLPDLDTQSSAIGGRLRFISRPLEARFGHRTITHSLLAVAGLFAVLLPLAWWRGDLYYCFCVGYATHPLLDTMTVNGVRLFYPLSGRKCVFPMDVNHPHRYRVQTGSRADALLGVVFLLASLPAYLVAQEGYERFVRITQGSIESAVRDYNDMSRTHRVFADVRAHSLLTKRLLGGRFELLGSVDERTLVFRADDRMIRTLGVEYESDYAADRVIAVRGEPAATRVQTIDLSGQRLKELDRMLDHDAGALLFGTLSVERDVSVPQASEGFQPIQGHPGSLRIAFATVREVMEAGLGDALVLRGTLTVRKVVDEGDSTHRPERLAAPFTIRSFSIAAGRGEQIVNLRREGDPVSIGDTLALRTSSAENHTLAGELHSELRRLDEDLEARRTTYLERRAELLEQCRRDSADIMLAVRLQAAGFSTYVSIDARRAAQARRLYQRVKLDAAFRRMAVRSSERMRRTGERIREFQAADSSTRGALRSPVNGTIRSIRSVDQAGAMQMVFSIEVADTPQAVVPPGGRSAVSD